MRINFKIKDRLLSFDKYLGIFFKFFERIGKKSKEFFLLNFLDIQTWTNDRHLKKLKISRQDIPEFFQIS